MTLSIKNNYLRLLVFVVVLFGSFFWWQSAKAQRCCLVSERERVVIKNASGQLQQSSRVKVRSGIISCGIAPTSGCVSPEGVIGPDGEVYATDEEVFRKAFSNTALTIIDRTVTEVSCLSHSMCAQEVAKQTDCSIFKGNPRLCLNAGACFANGSECLGRYDSSICASLPKDICGTAVGSQVCKWQKLSDGKAACYSLVEAEFSSRYDGSGLLPSCAYAGVCRDVNDLLRTLIKITQYLFSFIGGTAFVVFILAGVRIILSFGNSEKVKAGQQMLLAAVVGLIISFSAFFLISFLLDSLSVGEGTLPQGTTKKELRGGIQ